MKPTTVKTPNGAWTRSRGRTPTAQVLHARRPTLLRAAICEATSLLRRKTVLDPVRTR